MDFPFEDVEVKENAPELLEKALRSKRKKCMIGTGAMTDPYMHCEEKLFMMRRCLALIEQYGFGVAVQTKSDRILRDLDILKRINEKTKAVVQITLTTYDEELCKILEPKVCTTQRRAEVLNIMRDNGIPTVVWLDPILPFINDTEENIRGILDYCIKARVKGIICFGMGLTLREGNREYFYRKLEEHFPGMKEKYRQKYGLAYEVNSDHHQKLMGIFYETCRKHGIESNINKNFEYLHTFEDKEAGKQLSLFDGLL
jgi:DNA repair photolyase